MVIDTLELNIVVDNKGTTARINNTTNALKNLHKVISDINGAGGVDGAVNGGGGSGSSSRGGSSRSSGAKSASSLMKNLNFGSMIAKLYFVRNITKQLGQNLAKVVQYGIDYEETLNLWQTAMRGNISQARVFTSEMTKAYGISSATLMNYQATFKNMLSALGNISETTAYGLSEALTQMALDFSSLYNVSVESAMTKFQAVLSGQVRPIRTAGYDITEQTLFQLYQSIGGTKTVRQLNQTEKQLLRILAVYKQMERSGATGDLAKTITSSANQLRIMNEQGKEFATWIGVAFNTMLEKSGILVEINAWLYAGVALAKQLAIEMGYVEKDYGISWSDDIADASDEYEKFKGKLLGFDKFQVLQSAGTDNADVEQVLLDSIKAYQGLLDSAGNPAFERSLEILKSIGLELDENGNIVGGFDKVKDRAVEIAKALGVVALIVGFIANPWLALAGAIEYCYWTNEDFKKSVDQIVQEIKPLLPYIVQIIENLLPIIEQIANGSLPIILGATSQIIDILSPILQIIERISYYLNQVMPYALFVISAFLTPIAMGLDTILNIVESILEVIRTIFAWDWNNLKQNLSEIWSEKSGWDITIGAAKSVYEYGKIVIGGKADGGLATKGSLFYAGEAGPELVTQTSGGGSTIMNMKQLEDAVFNGFVRGMLATDTNDNDNLTEIYVDGQRLFEIVRGVARRNGYELVKV
jgi:phage-related protein